MPCSMYSFLGSLGKCNTTVTHPVWSDPVTPQLKPVSWDSIKQSQHLVYTPMEEVHCTSARQGIIICQRPLVCWNKTCHLVFSGNGISSWRFDQIIYSCQNNKHLFWKRKEDTGEHKWMSNAVLPCFLSLWFAPSLRADDMSLSE